MSSDGFYRARLTFRSKQTEKNKAGHKRAEELGFQSMGPHHSGGWKNAKVKCVKCGHQLPWYHHHYQEKHRAKCGEAE